MNPRFNTPSLFYAMAAGLLFFSMFASAAPRPNIILVMADDMGWGDPGYNSITVKYPDGTPHPDQGWISTPTLDSMVSSGLRFGRFYSASAVCSPTRASCLTGRNPLRVGVPYANIGRMGFDETPLSEVLSDAGYTCGHFGKWHLGSLTTLRSDSNRGGDASVYSGPWHHSYDTCFVTESKVPTYHPYRKTVNGAALPTSFSDPNFYGTRYWRMPDTWNETSGEGAVVPVEEVNNVENGDDSKLVVDQTIPFIRNAVSNNTPFFAVVWFHTPHKPLVDPAGVAGVDSSTALKACVEDLDTALGRLRTELDTLGVRTNTMLWFTSDNGPEDGANSPNETSKVRSIRSGRNLERKRSLHEGGVRVPGILEWPAVIGEAGGVTEFPSVTSDYYPTILDYLELSVPNQKPLDGISLRPVIEGTATNRTQPIGFECSGDKSWVNQQYKLINDNGSWQLFDLLNVPVGEELEQTPLATSANIGSQSQNIQEVYSTMLAEHTAWKATVNSDTPYVHASQPTVSLSTLSNSVSGPFAVIATFSESVTQLHANEFVIGNGNASGLSGSGTNWTVTVVPSSKGTVSVSLPEGCAIDADGNPNAAANDIEVMYQPPGPPSVTLSGPEQTTSAYTVHVDFDEPVTGLSTGDFVVVNGSASGLSGSGASYTITITPASNSDVSVTLPADAVTDLDDGLGNTASAPLVTGIQEPTPGQIVANGDLNTEPITSTDAGGDTAYTSSVGTDNWFITSVSRGFTYDASGGDTGEGGAFVSAGDFNQKPRGVLQFAQDDKAATGLQSFGIDVFMDDNTAANELILLVELYGWNTTSPRLSVGGATANDPTWNVTTLNGATTILNTSIPKSSVADASWQTVDIGDVDVGTGYNYYAWRIGIMGATIDDVFAFDNVTAVGSGPESGYDRWALTNGVGAATNDFDADGLNNLYEYGVGGNPTNALDRGTLPAFTKSGSSFIYVHPQRSDDASLVYLVETTTNLVSSNWTNEGYTVTGTNVTGDTLNFVTNDVDTVQNEKFIRLKIRN